jgi:hypothetical protein
MYEYRLAYQALDNLATLEEKIIIADSQVDAMDKLRTNLIEKGRVLDFVFSVVRMVD